MTQPALSRLEAGGVVPASALLEWISVALDAVNGQVTKLGEEAGDGLSTEYH
jgi:hypothetical protein